jgi:hypothetical protein
MTHETPSYVTDGLRLLDALWNERYEGGRDMSARTANHGGQEIVTPTFELRAYCWCSGERQDHEENCPPNFRHPASGLEVLWYKHAERGSTVNVVPSVLQWASVLRECIDAVLASPPPYRVLITGSREFGAGLRHPQSKSRFRDDWASVPSAQRDAMVEAFRGARERAGGRPIVVVEGDAAGADRLAGALARRSGCEVEEWPALWRREDGSLRGGYDRAEALRVRSVYSPAGGYYRQAGPERNRAMVASGADECLAFRAVGAGNRGTDDCIAVAKAAGIPVTVIEA